MYKSIKESVRWFLYRGLYKPGHYYSPVPLWKNIEERKEVIFKEETPAGIDMKLDSQSALLEQFAAFSESFDWPETQSGEKRYYWNNNFYNKTDGFILYSIMRQFKPRRIVEIGSGFSSALMLDVNDQYFNSSIELTFIEPYPERLKSLLRESDNRSGKTAIIEKMIQDTDLSVFQKLEAGDILLIDSSHISKVGSDVNYLFFKILPVLAKGVIIHVHDICYPFEYPADWIRQGIYWNEAYLLRSFMMYNNAFEILMFNNYWKNRSLKALPHIGVGGSIWLKRTM